MLYPKDYEHFSLLVKRYVELALILKIIPCGAILSEKQEKTFRLVQSKFKGFSYQQRFSNEVLRADCERILALYMKGPFSVEMIKKRGG
jgi:hypothetical protein